MKQFLLPAFKFLLCFVIIAMTAVAAKAGELTVSPNPAAEKIQIRFVPENETATYTVIAITGNVVRQGSLNPTAYTSIDVEELPPGIYLLNITDGTQELTTRFVRR